MAKQLSFAISDELQQTLKKTAKEECTGVSTIVRMAIRDFLRVREENKKKSEGQK